MNPISSLAVPAAQPSVAHRSTGRRSYNHWTTRECQALQTIWKSQLAIMPTASWKNLQRVVAQELVQKGFSPRSCDAIGSHVRAGRCQNGCSNFKSTTLYLRDESAQEVAQVETSASASRHAPTEKSSPEDAPWASELGTLMDLGLLTDEQMMASLASLQDVATITDWPTLEIDLLSPHDYEPLFLLQPSDLDDSRTVTPASSSDQNELIETAVRTMEVWKEESPPTPNVELDTAPGVYDLLEALDPSGVLCTQEMLGSMGSSHI